MPPSHVRKRPAAGSALPPRAARSVARRRPAAATTAALLAKPDLAPRKRRRNAAYAAKHAARERARRRRRQPEGPRDGFRMEIPSGPLLRYGQSPACRGTRLLPQRYQNLTPLSRVRDCMILGTRAPCFFATGGPSRQCRSAPRADCHGLGQLSPEVPARTLRGVAAPGDRGQDCGAPRLGRAGTGARASNACPVVARSSSVDKARLLHVASPSRRRKIAPRGQALAGRAQCALVAATASQGRVARALALAAWSCLLVARGRR